MDIRAALYAWRDSEAKARNIENFRVLPNATLDDIARAAPRSKDELCAVKGIKEMKFSQYGKAILHTIENEISSTKEQSKPQVSIASISSLMNHERKEAVRPAYSVSQYLDVLNHELNRVRARITGDVVSLQVRGNALYFSLKDKESESVLSVFMWSSDYRLSGVELKEGLEVIVEGRAEIYKPTGRLSLRADTLELVGEGALKKAYDLLKLKLEKEGLFTEDRKRKISEYPLRIGLITSKQGAVIHDFLNNLGQFGYKISFYDSRVEGVLAIRDLMTALSAMCSKDIDVLVVIRGGGSLESLQAFNNEYVVRAIAEFPVPVICAIGHDKDVPLAQLVADYSPSTPSMCTAIINDSWNTARFHVQTYQNEIFAKYATVLQDKLVTVTRAHAYFDRSCRSIERKIAEAIGSMSTCLPRMQESLYALSKEAARSQTLLNTAFPAMQKSIEDTIRRVAAMLEAYDPMRQLKLGYSLLRSKGQVLHSISEVRIGDTIEATVADGVIIASAIKTTTHDKKGNN